MHSNDLTRRHFLKLAGAAAPIFALAHSTGGNRASGEEANSPPAARLLFTAHGKTGIVGADGTGLRYFEFDVPNQATWQPGPIFPDGERIVFLSMEPRRDGPGKPFEEYYTQTPTHLWLHDLRTGSLDELCTRERRAPFVTPALLIGADRLLVQVVKDRVGQIVSVKLDGSDAREFTKPGEGLPYGLSLSPAGQRVAFHLASPEGYQIWTSDLDGGERVKIAANASRLYFGPSWSPDGQWLAYADCDYHHDPGHDWADVCVSRADGSEQRKLTEGGAMWFAATYGGRDTHGGGSNLLAWSRDGAILFPRRSAGAQIPWQYQTGRPDVDHFNRDFKPEEARGGVSICRLDPRDGTISQLTPAAPGVWDFRVSQSPDGRQLVFCRAKTGEGPAVLVMKNDGGEAREITAGRDEFGADHPRWLG